MTGSEDTIAAISSGLTESGIGIIRISGEKAIETADRMVRLKSETLGGTEAGRIRWCHVTDGDTLVDEALVFVMRAPHSYTGEDVAEIQCHGGAFLMRRVLGLAIKNGARLAEPGEFTKRAFLNGRLDLAQAEAVMSLISSRNEFARRAAFEQLSGSLSTKINALRSEILSEAAFLEAAIDDPEHISTEGYREGLIEKLGVMTAEIDALILASENGEVLREGIPAVILGSPNVGKSSIMNLLLDRERAIVTDIPGTTRDILEETVRIGELTLLLKDTAGLRETSDKAEQIGVERAREAAMKAELILYVIDAARALSDAEIQEIRTAADGRKIILLLNKTDLEGHVSAEEIADITGIVPIEFSAKTGQGQKELIDNILTILGDRFVAASGTTAIANLRQCAELRTAGESLRLVLASARAGMSEDLFTIDLMDAYNALSRIVGEAVDDALADRIFADFCMGK